MYEPNIPTANDEIIDSRDVIFWIARLEETEVIDREPEDQEALDALYALQEEAEGSPDWQYGETLIRDDYFEDYARELAEDIGAVNPDAAWPLSFIDWEAAADALRSDYFSVTFEGETYWIRG